MGAQNLSNMRNFLNAFWMTIVFCGIMGFSYAQEEAMCMAKAPSEVVVNQHFQYTVTTTEKGTVLETDFGKFEFVGGPSMGSSTSISIANGHTEQSTQYTYTYVLVCKREGTFTIPGVSISVDGKVLRSNAVEVKVVKASKQSKDNSANGQTDPFRFEWPDFFGGNNPSQQPNSENVEYKDDIKKEDLFVKTEIAQAEAWQGEAVVVTHKLYIKQDIRGYDIARANYAATDALWLDRLDQTYSDESTETIKGERYHVYTILQTAAYPLKTGKVTIPKLDLIVRIGVPAVVKNPFWGSMTTTRAKDFRLTSNEVSFKVKPLPGARNDGKTETVGHFDISASISKTELSANQSVVLTVTVSGNGNLHHVEASDLNIEFPSDCDVTYPKVSQHIGAKGNLVSGTKTFKFTLIPRSEGEYFIPGASFTYYDDETQTYKTITTQDFRLDVKPGRTPSTQDDEKSDKPKGKIYKI
jgi:hypothetical protein